MRGWAKVWAGLVCGFLVGCAAGAQGVMLGQAGTPQLQQAQGPTGTVTGRVVAADTQRPVRFAMVLLQAVSTAQGGDETRGVGVRLGSFGGNNVSARTDVEGNFVLTGVPVGDYYVSAAAPGFIAERNWLQAKVAAGVDPAVLLAGIPMVRVSADGTSSATVTLERGGVISGKVVWEDGSAAAGVSLTVIPSAAFAVGGNPVVTALPAVLQGLQGAGGFPNFATTDDRGMFRITGLTSGDYYLRALIQSPVQMGGRPVLQNVSTIAVYSPGVFRRGEAKAVSVREGDERSDVRMVIDLRGVHQVAGHVSSATVGVNVASGQVTLSDAGDRTLQLVGRIGGNGDFVLPYVPPGTYTMTVTGSSRELGGRRTMDGGDKDVGFQVSTTPLVVGDTDVRGVSVTLTPVQAGP